MTSQGVASSDSSDSSDSSSAEVFVVKEAVFHEDPTESTDMMRAEILGVYQSSADAQNKALELYSGTRPNMVICSIPKDEGLASRGAGATLAGRTMVCITRFLV